MTLRDSYTKNKIRLMMSSVYLNSVFARVRIIGGALSTTIYYL